MLLQIVHSKCSKLTKNLDLNFLNDSEGKKVPCKKKCTFESIKNFMKNLFMI